MKNINLILALALIMSFTACKKNREVIIQAQNLTDLSDGSHYAGANYVVLEKKTTLYGEQNKNVASGVLDDNGHASFDLKMKNNRRYALGIQEPSNVCYTQITIEEYLINGENNTFNFEYAPCGTVNLPFVNSNCEGENDEFRYKYYYTQDTNIYIYWAFWGSDFTNLTGCLDYSNSNFSEYYNRPAGDYTIEWEVKRPSGITYGSDTFTITEGDTTNYLIEY